MFSLKEDKIQLTSRMVRAKGFSNTAKIEFFLQCSNVLFDFLTPIFARAVCAQPFGKLRLVVFFCNRVAKH